MATKSQKIKTPFKDDKKSTEKLEISLRKKIKDFVFSLGHDAEEIGDEIKKTSKVLAKRLNRKMKSAKKSIDEKVSQVKKFKKAETKKSTVKVDKIVSQAKKDGKKLAKKATSVKNVDVLPVINKVAKKAVPVAKKAISSAKKAVPVTKKAIPATKTTAKPVQRRKPQTEELPEPKDEKVAHPETPEVTKRKPKAPIPKSDTKPINTDLPLEAGPRNKYKRG